MARLVLVLFALTLPGGENGAVSIRAYRAGVGRDFASGLGTPDIANLANAWK
jgi:hypothetical protein